MKKNILSIFVNTHVSSQTDLVTTELNGNGLRVGFEHNSCHNKNWHLWGCTAAKV